MTFAIIFHPDEFEKIGNQKVIPLFCSKCNGELACELCLKGETNHVDHIKHIHPYPEQGEEIEVQVNSKVMKARITESFELEIGLFWMKGNGYKYWGEKVEELARREGYSSVDEFFLDFNRMYFTEIDGKVKPMKFRIIRWEYL